MSVCGSSIRVVSQNSAVSCEVDDVGKPYPQKKMWSGYCTYHCTGCGWPTYCHNAVERDSMGSLYLTRESNWYERHNCLLTCCTPTALLPRKSGEPGSLPVPQVQKEPMATITTPRLISGVSPAIAAGLCRVRVCRGVEDSRHLNSTPEWRVYCGLLSCNIGPRPWHWGPRKRFARVGYNEFKVGRYVWNPFTMVGAMHNVPSQLQTVPTNWVAAWPKGAYRLPS